MKNMLWLVLLFWSSTLFSQDTVKWLIPVGKYDKIRPWNEYFLVSESGRWGVLDKKLKTLVAPRFSRIEIMDEWALGMVENDKWGFRHRNDLSKWAVQPLYQGDEWGDIQRNQGHDHSWIFYINGKARSITFTKEKIVVGDPGKRPVSVAELKDPVEPEPTTPPQPFVSQPWHSQWKEVHPIYSLYDETKKNPSADIFEIIDKDGKHGMADAKGSILIPVRYHWMTIMNPQTIVVRENNPSRFSFFRRSDGKLMSKEYGDFRRTGLHKESPVKVSQKNESSGRWLVGLLNPSGEELVACQYLEFAEQSTPGFMPARTSAGWGLINTKNKVLLPFEYEEIKLAGLDNSSFVLVTKAGKTGVLQVK